MSSNASVKKSGTQPSLGARDPIARVCHLPSSYRTGRRRDRHPRRERPRHVCGLPAPARTALMQRILVCDDDGRTVRALHTASVIAYEEPQPRAAVIPGQARSPTRVPDLRAA
jgi:hypothetical protein